KSPLGNKRHRADQACCANVRNGNRIQDSARAPRRRIATRLVAIGTLPPNSCAVAGVGFDHPYFISGGSFCALLPPATLVVALTGSVERAMRGGPVFMAGALRCPNARISRPKSGVIESTAFAGETPLRRDAQC